MKRSSLFALLLASSLATPAYAQEVSFTKLGFKAGDRFTKTDTSASQEEVAFLNNGQPLQTLKQKGERRLEKRVEVLAAVDGRPTRLLVAYRKLHRLQDSPLLGGQQVITDPLEGKSFIVEKKGEAIAVTDAQGGKVDALLAGAVRAREGRLFGEHPLKFSELLPDRPIKIGETLQVDKEKASGVFGDEGGDALKVEALSLRLEKTQKRDGLRIAVFAVELKGQLEPQGPGGSKIALDLSGVLEMRLDETRPHALRLSGPLKYEQSRGPALVRGTGTTTITVRMTYGRKDDATGG